MIIIILCTFYKIVNIDDQCGTGVISLKSYYDLLLCSYSIEQFHTTTRNTINNMTPVAMGKDYYQILNLTRSGTGADVKKAYRKLSLKHHPDRSDDPKSDELFLEVFNLGKTSCT